MKNYNADKEDQGPKASLKKKRQFEGVSVAQVAADEDQPMDG